MRTTKNNRVATILMSIIYVTPFDPVKKECTAVSIDSGYKSIEDVIESLGDGYISANPMFVIYGDNKNRAVFSNNFKWKR